MEDAAAVSSGRYFTMAVRQDGTLWGWGTNYERQFAAAFIHECNAPRMVTDRQGAEVLASAVSAGAGHVLITATDGRLLAAGEDFTGALGDGGELDETVDDIENIHLVEVLLPAG